MLTYYHPHIWQTSIAKFNPIPVDKGVMYNVYAPWKVLANQSQKFSAYICWLRPINGFWTPHPPP